MATRYFCDRCGRETRYPNDLLLVDIPAGYRTRWRNRLAAELCPMCEDALRAMLRASTEGNTTRMVS